VACGETVMNDDGWFVGMVLVSEEGDESFVAESSVLPTTRDTTNATTITATIATQRTMEQEYSCVRTDC